MSENETPSPAPHGAPHGAPHADDARPAETARTAHKATAHHIRSFTPRRSRVTHGQRKALERLWPKWGLEVDERTRLDLPALFDTLPPDAPIVLEIGFGMGEATVQMAADDPGTGILAVDVHTPGHGNLLRLADLHGLSNIRVVNGDAIILLRHMLPPASLAGLRLYFPDPWPKKRHHKRRIVQPEFLDLAAVPLAPGALVHLATDWEPYAEHMLEVLNAHPAYENTQPDSGASPPKAGEGFAPRPESRPFTRFEGQGLDKGHRVHDLLFRRR
ncbi:tRNA (guanosine(46)-N7)-methyltransferase TrmB [Streptomyces armeniacus]|uniref:tRNA (guanosine(46)-N7)-methyltransferase TrmB n=1 Tax=Streptomyces armeniacus TaxID=83291 RepID=UPI001FEB9F06|nr:tRNA (guanosine(46)-N7)-methyltransferase TrmB [Streptomyces armeniacus]